MRRAFYLTLGWICFGLGVVGALLPIMPTTPFMIAAAWAFSRGSKRWHRWLLQRPIVGPILADWERHGVIRPAARRAATIGIVVAFSITFALVVRTWPMAVLHLSIAAAVLGYIHTRPSKPRVPEP